MYSYTDSVFPIATAFIQMSVDFCLRRNLCAELVEGGVSEYLPVLLRGLSLRGMGTDAPPPRPPHTPTPPHPRGLHLLVRVWMHDKLPGNLEQECSTNNYLHIPVGVGRVSP